MNYSKYKKAQELDNEIKNTEEMICKAEVFSEKIDEEKDNTAMLMVGNNKIYFNKDIAKIIIQSLSKYMLQYVEDKKKVFKSL